MTLLTISLRRNFFHLQKSKRLKKVIWHFYQLRYQLKKSKINYGTIDVEETLTDEEIKDFIEKTNPYISQDKDIIKYTKKAKFL